MKRMLLIGAALAAMTLAGNSEAKAGGFGLQFHIGHRHGHYGGGYYGGGYYGGQRRYSGYGGYGYYRRPYWHDTSHFDYHHGGFVPHGNHYHYIPGHYHFHRQGHWHH